MGWQNIQFAQMKRTGTKPGEGEPYWLVLRVGHHPQQPGRLR